MLTRWVSLAVAATLGIALLASPALAKDCKRCMGGCSMETLRDAAAACNAGLKGAGVKDCYFNSTDVSARNYCFEQGCYDVGKQDFAFESVPCAFTCSAPKKNTRAKLTAAQRNRVSERFLRDFWKSLLGQQIQDANAKDFENSATATGKNPIQPAPGQEPVVGAGSADNT